MNPKTFVPLVEGRLDPEAEGRTPFFILALTHGTRVVALPPGFAARDDHLDRAQALVRAPRTLPEKQSAQRSAHRRLQLLPGPRLGF